jgi:hypothetical protein
VNWEKSAGAGSYQVSVTPAQGTTTPACTGTAGAEATSLAMPTCAALTEGAQYKISVEATGGSAVSATNNDFSFHVGSFVLGQPDAASAPARFGANSPHATLFIGSKFLMAECGNNRVRIWNSFPASSTVPANVVLGQPNLSSTASNAGGASGRTLSCAYALASDGTKLIVSDRFNNRVLIWNAVPTHSFVSADVVVGQPDLTTVTPNTGGISASSLTEPMATTDGTRLIVSDRYNHRVLIWNTIPNTNNAPANRVLGQANFTSGASNRGGLVSSQSLADPFTPFWDGTYLYVADLGNHRVLRWTGIPGTDGAAAGLVLGQPSFTTDADGATASAMNLPQSVSGVSGRLYVSEYQNHRVLVWTSTPTTNGQAADLVLGQADFTSALPNRGGSPAADTMSAPLVYAVSSGLYVSDRFNNRLLVFNEPPTTNGQAPLSVMFQRAANEAHPNANLALSASSFDSPRAFSLPGDRMAVADGQASRVLLWTSRPKGAADAPALVLGQPDMTSSATPSAFAANTLCNPGSVDSDGTRLVVADTCASRVLIWNTLPTSNRQPADLVLGQPDMSSGTPNNGGVSAQSLDHPRGVRIIGSKLFVADSQNQRVLIWNTFPTTTRQAADVVLGQPNTSSNVVNNGGVSASSLSNPTAVASDGTRLFVADTSNRRVLLWDAIPGTNYQAANLVLGQPTMTAVTFPAVSETTLRLPRDVTVSNGAVYVADAILNRVSCWRTVPTSNGQAADVLVGEAVTNPEALSAGSLSQPASAFVEGDSLFIGDTANGRVMVVPRP